MASYIPRQFACPQTVTHPCSNRAQCHSIIWLANDIFTSLILKSVTAIR